MNPLLRILRYLFCFFFKLKKMRFFHCDRKFALSMFLYKRSSRRFLLSSHLFHSSIRTNVLANISSKSSLLTYLDIPTQTHMQNISKVNIQSSLNMQNLQWSLKCQFVIMFRRYDQVQHNLTIFKNYNNFESKEECESKFGFSS